MPNLGFLEARCPSCYQIKNVNSSTTVFIRDDTDRLQWTLGASQVQSGDGIRLSQILVEWLQYNQYITSHQPLTIFDDWPDRYSHFHIIILQILPHILTNLSKYTGAAPYKPMTMRMSNK